MSRELLQKLLKWRKSVTYDDITFYIRIVTDQDIEESRKQALLESRKLRTKLRNTESDEYLLYLDFIQDITKDSLIEEIILLSSRRFIQEYITQNPRPILPKLGDFPSQEEQEEYEAAKDAREEEYLDNMQEYAKRWAEDFKAQLTTQSEDFVKNMYRSHRVDRVCEEIYQKEFEDRVVAASLYEDEKYNRRLCTLEEYKQFPTALRDFLKNEYEQLTVGTEDIKN